MRPWRFTAYQIDGADHPLISDWYDLQEPELRATFDDRIDFLSRRESWEDLQEIEELKRGETGLWWIRMKLRRTNYRVFGFVRQFPEAGNVGEFVLVIGCRKLGGPSATKQAGRIALCLRRQCLEFGRGETHEYVI